MRGRGYLALHYHYRNDSCIKMGTNESHFNVSLTVRGKVTKTVSTNQNFQRDCRAKVESNRDPSAYQANPFTTGPSQLMDNCVDHVSFIDKSNTAQMLPAR